ncbi:type II toxin-antitoxin system RelE/ParE family toxin [Methylobacterium oryzihabitans]|uniref:Plasmid maintenance system killer protein n=1 Tax=Methylobacterium oryzihabitans TaxID=2499852 RepID=A0A3S2V9H4_9HYPH|nr:type II toxin-antitoxin system RelE/ParE family toxin [Methylobacterium oryzihabitans]RVU17716.1 plasmid maintenance system killer protein [Methylobacterium oryzihabitans]
MIRSFKDKGLRRFAEKGETRKLSVPNTDRIARLLVQLNAATKPEDMNLPGYRFDELGGDRKGTDAVNASANDRLTFAWDAPDAIDVDLEDYH